MSAVLNITVSLRACVHAFCRLFFLPTLSTPSLQVTSNRLLADVPPEEILQAVGANVIGSLLGRCGSWGGGAGLGEVGGSTGGEGRRMG